jgi:hypothetical protein
VGIVGGYFLLHRVIAVVMGGFPSSCRVIMVIMSGYSFFHQIMVVYMGGYLTDSSFIPTGGYPSLWASRFAVVACNTRIYLFYFN